MQLSFLKTLVSLYLTHIIVLRFFVFAVFLTFSKTTLAADLHACGIAYQSTPCPNKAKSMPAGKTFGPIVDKSFAEEKPPVIPVDSDCKRRGNAAKKIIARRQIGKTASEQIAATKSTITQALISEVYSHHGTSLQIKNAIISTCLNKKQKLTATQMKQVAANSNATDQTLVATKKVVLPKNTNKKSNQFSTCGTLKTDLDKINKKRINGGATDFLNDLQEQQTLLMREMKATGCYGFKK